jgi:hypothetical protein
MSTEGDAAMVTKHYLALYLMLFAICLIGGLIGTGFNPRAEVLLVALAVALVFPIVMIWVLRKLGYPAGREIHCARCNATMPMFRKPNSMRQGLWGGFTCHACGAELDARGREIATQG